MNRHFTYTQSLFPDEILNGNGASLEKFVYGVGLICIILVLAKLAGDKIRTDKQKEELLAPSKVNLFGIFDFLFEAFVKFNDSILGKENRRFVPFTASIFTFILSANLLGLVPGMPAITSTVWINLALAFIVFIGFNFFSLVENGLLGFFEHFCGGKQFTRGGIFTLVVGILLFPIELVSTFMRVLTLNLRLYWNINADHMVLASFTDLVPYVVPVFFYAMGTLVAFLQALVFTLLTMIYILLATHHEEESH